MDASAMIEALVGAEPSTELLDSLAGDVAAPHLLDIEVLSTLRGLVLGGRLTAERAALARAQHFALTVHRYEIGPLEERIWTLRHQITAYDASYIALAEGLRVPLLTCDRRLVAGGHRAQIRVFDTTR